MCRGKARLLAHLSEATAGSLNGVGHSTAYEELATYKLAVKYLFSSLANEGIADHTAYHSLSNRSTRTRSRTIARSLGPLLDIIADERVFHFFGRGGLSAAGCIQGMAS
jgi:hypothetical protein